MKLYESRSRNFRFLQSTVGGLHATQPPTIRISAIRAVYSYCQHLKSANTTQYLIPFLPNILDGLLSIATQFSSDVLSLCLETLSILLTVSWSRLSITISVIVKTISFLSLSLLAFDANFFISSVVPETPSLFLVLVFTFDKLEINWFCQCALHYFCRWIKLSLPR